jgi:hypothetical protein
MCRINLQLRMRVTVQNVAALFAHFSLNCLFFVNRPLFFFNAFKLILLFLFSLYYMSCFLFCVYCDLCCFSLSTFLLLPFVHKCKDHCHQV